MTQPELLKPWRYSMARILNSSAAVFKASCCGLLNEGYGLRILLCGFVTLND